MELAPPPPRYYCVTAAFRCAACLYTCINLSITDTMSYLPIFLRTFMSLAALLTKGFAQYVAVCPLLCGIVIERLGVVNSDMRG